MDATDAGAPARPSLLDPQSSPLVIGYGNPLRADDGFGWEVAQRLSALLPAGAATVVAVHQLTPELAEPIADASLVIFVDVDSDGAPGVVVQRTVDPSEGAPAVFSHEAQPQTLLALADRLYGRCPSGVIISVGGADFDYRAGLSPAVAAATPTALAHIRELLGIPLSDSERDGRAEACMK